MAIQPNIARLKSLLKHEAKDSSGGMGIRLKIKALTAATTVTTDQCGTLFTLGTAGGFAVVLPNAADCGPGWWCRFTVKVAPTTAYTVDASSGDGNNVHGIVVSAEQAAADSTVGTATDTITFVANKAHIGDFIELWTDGSRWYAVAYASEQDGITYS